MKKFKKLLASVFAFALAFSGLSAMPVQAGQDASTLEDGTAYLNINKSDWSDFEAEYTNATITGDGSYTVAMTAAEAVDMGEFNALEVVNGETVLGTGCVLTVDSIKINGEEVELQGPSYTCSADGAGVNTRVNLYNEYNTPDAAATAGDDKHLDQRVAEGSVADATATLISKDARAGITTLEVAFTVSGFGTAAAVGEAAPAPEAEGPAVAHLSINKSDWSEFEAEYTDAEITGDGTYTVRATGGNNANRFLLIAGFGTDITNTCNSKYKMPADTAKDKLLVSVHYYDPSGYCINSSLATWGTKQDYQTMNETLELMTKFTEQGYGVIIGEYGVLMETGELKENAADYTRNFLNNCDLYGYCPVLWDCSNLYDRQTCSIVDMGMGRLYTKHSLEIQSEQSKEDIIARAQKEMDADFENAKEAAGVADDVAMAWIMYNSSDWNTMYSVGDTYAPDDKTAGIAATDVEVPAEARVREDNGQELTPCILDADTLGNVETISVTFDYVAGE